MNKSKLLKVIVCVGLFGMYSSQILADDSFCEVLRDHEPNSNIYDGPTWCGAISLSYLTVHGPLHLNKTKIKGKTDVGGPVTATSAHLNTLLLENQLTPVRVTLNSGTIVDGNITFKGLAGKIYLNGGSKINGKVINGKIVKGKDDDKLSVPKK